MASTPLTATALGHFFTKNEKINLVKSIGILVGFSGIIFLFSDNLLQTSIPELLSQTGTNGRQFAHILIRSYQEKHQNQFPDIERAAEEIGQKRFPLSIRNILDLYKKVGLKVKYFDRPPFVTENDSGHKIRTLFRSFFKAS